MASAAARRRGGFSTTAAQEISTPTSTPLTQREYAYVCVVHVRHRADCPGRPTRTFCYVSFRLSDVEHEDAVTRKVREEDMASVHGHSGEENGLLEPHHLQDAARLDVDDE